MDGSARIGQSMKTRGSPESMACKDSNPYKALLDSVGDDPVITPTASTRVWHCSLRQVRIQEAFATHVSPMPCVARSFKLRALLRESRETEHNEQDFWIQPSPPST